MLKFQDMHLADKVMSAICDMGFTDPTPVQQEVIPIMQEGRDILAKAPTGTGKTCAFIIPIVGKIDADDDSTQCLILCPTRELAVQIGNEMKKILKFSESIRHTTIYGGQNIERQLASLRKRPQIVVATPGRLMDHMRRKTIRLNNIKTIVLDEADEMLNMGFRDDIDEIIKSVPSQRQTVMFSATFANDILNISKTYQQNPVTIKVSDENASELPKVKQYALTVKKENKKKLLINLCESFSDEKIIIFCNTKKMVTCLETFLYENGFMAQGIHGDLRQRNRDTVMRGFKEGASSILIASDVAARGIDVSGIGLVLNYDAPQNSEYYVHRIGRTARAGKSGVAITIIERSQRILIKEYEKLMKLNISTDINEEINSMEERRIKNAFDNITKNLTKEKAELESYLAEFNTANTTEFTALDFFASFVKGNTIAVDMLEQEKTQRISSGRRNERGDDQDFRSERSGESRERSFSSNGKRYFINIGTRDEQNVNTIKQFVSSNCGVEEFLDFKMMDNFGFIEVNTEEGAAIMTLNGANFNGRKIFVEEANKKDGGSRSGGGRPPRSNGGGGYSSFGGGGGGGRGGYSSGGRSEGGSRGGYSSGGRSEGGSRGGYSSGGSSEGGSRGGYSSGRSEGGSRGGYSSGGRSDGGSSFSSGERSAPRSGGYSRDGASSSRPRASRNINSFVYTKKA